MGLEVAHGEIMERTTVNGLSEWGQCESWVHCEQTLDVSETELRETGKVEEFTQDVANNIYANFVYCVCVCVVKESKLGCVMSLCVKQVGNLVLICPQS